MLHLQDPLLKQYPLPLHVEYLLQYSNQEKREKEIFTSPMSSLEKENK